MSVAETAPRRLRLNAVLDREVRERMRSGRSVVIILITLALLAGVLYLAYYAGSISLRNAGLFQGGFTTTSLGRLMFEWLVLVEMVLLTFIAPGISAGAIVGERERRTLNLLQLTLLTPRSIALGKLGASVSYLLLLIMASAPLFTVPMVLGGVGLWLVVKALIVLCTFTIFLSCLGLYLSSVARRIQFSIVAAYLLTFLFVVGSWVAFGLETFGRETGFIPLQGLPFATYANPMLAVADAVTEPGFNSFGPSPLTSMGSMLGSMRDRTLFDGGDGRDDLAGQAEEGFIVPVWFVFTVLTLAFSSLLIVLTALRLKLPAPILVIGRKG